MHEVMQAQDCLYTLVVKHPDGQLEPRVIGSIADYLFAPDDPEAVVARMADPATRIVSLTVTEGGYQRAPGDRRVRRPRRRTSSTTSRTRRAAAAHHVRLHHRGAAPPPRRRHPAFTVMSCDNIQGNGDVAHKMITAFARLQDPELADWIEREVPFPNSMVDRITPVTSDDDRAAAGRAVRRRGRLAGGVRAVHPVGAGGPLHRRPARRSTTVGRAAGAGRRCPTS